MGPLTRRAIFVFGMHRSGTSMIGGLLRALRVDMGSDQELMGPAPDNPKGFFEHLALYQLNVDILARLGGDWWQLPVFPSGWEGSDAFDDLRRRAGLAVRRSFGESSIWGFKDPRLSLTMPFWRIMTGCPLQCILMIRNPLDVAGSLKKRNDFPISLGVDLWRRYTVAAIANSSGLPRLPVLYEDFLENFDPEFGRLAEFCGLNWWKECRGAARAFAEDGMRNQRSAAADLESHPEVSKEVKDLYRGLRAHARTFRNRNDPRAEQDLDRIARPVRP